VCSDELALAVAVSRFCTDISLSDKKSFGYHWYLLRSYSGLPDGAKLGKYCQKSLFSKRKFANFFGNIF